MATFSASAAVGEMLRQPDDLVKLTAFRNKLVKEKATLDAKLQEGVRSQLDATRDALLKLQEARQSVAHIREEMIEVEKVKRDKDEGEVFDKITRVSGVHRNFSQTAKMVHQLQNMADKIANLERLLLSDRSQEGGPIGPSPNLLTIHFQLQQLEAFRNETMHQAKRGAKEDKAVLARWFEPLDLLTHEFEAWLWEIAAHVVELAGSGNGGTVVRLLKIVEFESKEDEKAVAVRLVRKVNNDTASKFRSMQANARVIKNYRHKMLDAMEAAVEAKFDAHYQDFGGDSGNQLGFIEGLESWLYADVVHIKDSMEQLFPVDYEIVQWYIKRYHKALNAKLTRIVESVPEAQVLLFLASWVKSYRQNMKQEVPLEWLQPPLLDGRSQDLIEDYAKLIITRLDEWTINLQKDELQKFKSRQEEPHQSGEGLFGMDGVVDFFELVNQQIDLSLDSNQGAVLARVVTEVGRVMHRVQSEWNQVVASEARALSQRPDEVPGGLVEYVMALANDQLRAADNTEILQSRLEPLVSEKYKPVITERLNEAIDGYLDVAKRCISTLTQFVFNDLRPATAKIFSNEWYSGQLCAQIIETMRDYMGDYQAHLNAALFDILVDDMIDSFLIVYLTGLRQAQGKSLRMPRAAESLRRDIGEAFDFFTHYKSPHDVEPSFEVMSMVCSMLEASPEMFFMDWWSFAQIHGPQLQFTEKLVRARDDIDRSAASELIDTLKHKAREDNLGDPTEPTIMVRIQGRSGAAGLMANIASYANHITVPRTLARRRGTDDM